MPRPTGDNHPVLDSYLREDFFNLLSVVPETAILLPRIFGGRLSLAGLIAFVHCDVYSLGDHGEGIKDFFPDFPFENDISPSND